MAFAILGTPRPQFFDSSGSPLASGTLSVLNPADDTNRASYPTADDANAATNANSNPITLDSRGECSLWGIDGTTYKLVLKDSSGTTIWTVDDVQTWNGDFGSTANGAGASLIGVEDAAGNLTATDVEAALAEIFSSLADPAKVLLYGGTPQTLTGAGAVNVTSTITHVVTTGTDALTLADGTEGQRKFIVMKTDGGDGTLTPSNLGNGTTITFDDVGDSADLLFTNGAWHFMGGSATLA